jgi:uncharacterized protein
MDIRHQKLEKLKDYLKSLESVAVAFSSGVDSTFLLKIAHDTLDDKAIAITAESASFPKREKNEAIEFCKKEKIKHFVIQSEELNIEGFRSNPPNRCYLCKSHLFKEIKELAKKENLKEVVEGSNTDDNGDYRPGLQAIAELNIKSPLRFANLSKDDIRILSKELNLPTWKKPSFACLASRFVYGEEITEEKLNMIDKAEQLLLDLGFNQVRCRIHGKMARIEISPDKFDKILKPEIRDKIYTEYKKIGFTYVTLDLKGYRTGSMNETLSINRSHLLHNKT